MYGIALSVSACLRAGTRTNVAWSLDPQLTPRFDPADAVALTPGGGKLGTLLGGAIDSRLIEEAAAGRTSARVVTIALHDHEAEIVGAPPGTELRIMLAPADALPQALWPELLERRTVGLVAQLDGTSVDTTDLIAVDGSTEVVDFADTSVTTVWRPRTTLVIMGSGPIAQALADAGRFVGWNTAVPPGTEAAIATATSLSTIDGIVVMGHDTESVGRVMQTALVSRAGYIGSLGPMSLQEARVEWLAYRGVTDLSRVHGPAGFDIGARTPAEIAISVVAEMIASQAR